MLKYIKSKESDKHKGVFMSISDQFLSCEPFGEYVLIMFE